MAYIIEVEGLSKSFKGVAAVNNISFRVKRGQCFGLLGPNGAGKTTTIEMLEGIMPADAGEILYNSRPMSRNDLEKIGIQFQHTALQDFLTVRDTIKLFSAFYPQPIATDDLIAMCQLHDFIDRDHRKLSGGQRQRLLLALALVNDPDVLFLDEPTTGLDPHSRRNFWDLITGVKKRGKTVILTTHYMDEAEYLCDEIVIMDQGVIIEQGHPNSLLAKHFSGALLRLDPQELPASIKTKYPVVQTEGYCEFATTNVQQAIQLLTEEGISLEGLHIKSANLDDLFLKLTGHQLEKA